MTGDRDGEPDPDRPAASRRAPVILRLHLGLRLHRSAPFLRAYRFLPQRLLNRAMGRLARVERPRPLVRALVRAWVRLADVPLDDFLPVEHRSLDEVFLRRLRPGARSLGPGLVSPVDATVVAAGRLERPGGDGDDATLMIKGERLSLDRLVNGRLHHLALDDYQGGHHAVLFLTPRGYHRIHMPWDGTIVSCQWLPGRFFPQNEDALVHLGAVHERNERLVVRCRLDEGAPAREILLVLVGASLVGGIHLEGVARAAFARPMPLDLLLRRSKGEEIGHFSFGSTVVVLVPRHAAAGLSVHAGSEVRMGQTLLAPVPS